MTSSYLSLGPAVVEWMKHYKWQTTTILSSTDNVFLDTADLWSTDIRASNLTDTMYLFKPGQFQTALLEDIGRSGVRVVFVLANRNDVQQIGLSAYQRGFTSHWAWISTDTFLGVERINEVETSALCKKPLIEQLPGCLTHAVQTLLDAVHAAFRGVQTH